MSDSVIGPSDSEVPRRGSAVTRPRRARAHRLWPVLRSSYTSQRLRVPSSDCIFYHVMAQKAGSCLPTVLCQDILGTGKRRDRLIGAPIRIRYTHAIVYFWFSHRSQRPLERKSPSEARPHAQWRAHCVTRPKADLRGRAAPRHACATGRNCPGSRRESDSRARSTHRARTRRVGHE